MDLTLRLRKVNKKQLYDSRLNAKVREWELDIKRGLFHSSMYQGLNFEIGHRFTDLQPAFQECETNVHRQVQTTFIRSLLISI